MAIAVYGGVLAQAQPAADASSRTRAFDRIFDQGMKNLLAGLRSENRGLTESAMMQVAKIKILYPGANVAETKNVIDSLSIHATIPSVRYKAYLASNVCDNPTWFAKRSNIEYENEFFESVAAQLQERILGSRTN
jgi:hypothetical protein